MVRIFHAADLHLGRIPYGLRERFVDFGRAFDWFVEEALRERPDLVVLAGDLFDHPQITPNALLLAVDGLERLRQAGIPVVAVEGNHDRGTRRARTSWPEYLCERELLILLAPEPGEEGLAFPLWDGRFGGRVEVAGVWLYGLPYAGASQPLLLDALEAALRADPPSGPVLAVGHFGIEGEIPGMAGGLPPDRLEGVEGVTAWLLGHLHKPFRRGNRILNPGSLEAASLREADWHGGYYDLVLEGRGVARAEHVPYPHRRPHLRLRLSVDDCRGPEEVLEALDALLAALPRDWPPERPPVVLLLLEGVLNFDRRRLDLGALRARLVEALQPLWARVEDRTGRRELAPLDAEMDRAALEAEILRRRFAADLRSRGREEAWTALALDLKGRVLRRESPEGVLEAFEAALEALEEG